MKLLIAGASGLVGGHVLRLALDDARVACVVAPTRRVLAPHSKLASPLVDFARLPADAPWWRADAVICTLGTTMKQAGSEDAFKRVDYDYPLAVARLAAGAGTRTYVLNSAIGADPSSRFFYNRVKGELERDLASLGFASLTCARPGLIGGARETVRTGEWLMMQSLALLGPVLPRRWRLNPAPAIAAALLEAAIRATPGVHVLGSEQLL
ncbi:NAD-dependent dehydratase [Massilia violaceinigra]|uniref:NAD-dependent dehydratase n=1 Tax=Massilia violaceinigra TaxID=2045208 RepID=A0ABY4A5V7_9BURK|nr:NAD-dependent dehydratase [Massilia violaceinigra]UOD30058.1 NAD-dependent dehydratase [Massilia violaceinigra]